MKRTLRWQVGAACALLTVLTLMLGLMGRERASWRPQLWRQANGYSEFSASPGGRYLVLDNDILDAESGRLLRSGGKRVYGVEEGALNGSIAFSRDERQVVIWHQMQYIDHHAKMWQFTPPTLDFYELPSMRRLRHSLWKAAPSVLQFSPDLKTAWTNGGYCDAMSGRVLPIMPTSATRLGDRYAEAASKVSPDGTRALLQNFDTSRELDDGSDGDLYSFPQGQHLAILKSVGPVDDIVWSPNGKLLLVRTDVATRIFNARTGRLQWKLSNSISWFSPDAKRVATIENVLGYKPRLSVRDAENGALQRVLPLPANANTSLPNSTGVPDRVLAWHGDFVFLFERDDTGGGARVWKIRAR